MSTPEPKKREWPKLARSPEGNTAKFQCRGDVPAGWVVVGEEPEVVAEKITLKRPTRG